jgi:hypothetical protein
LVEGDTAYDTDIAMFYTLYHIFKQESIQGRGTIKGRHLALYQIFKTTGTVFTTKYVINIYISSQNDPFYTKQSFFFLNIIFDLYIYTGNIQIVVLETGVANNISSSRPILLNFQHKDHWHMSMIWGMVALSVSKQEAPMCNDECFCLYTYCRSEFDYAFF